MNPLGQAPCRGFLVNQLVEWQPQFLYEVKQFFVSSGTDHTINLADDVGSLSLHVLRGGYATHGSIQFRAAEAAVG